MSTCIHLAKIGELEKWDVELGWRQQEMRAIYLGPEAVRWLRNDLPAVESAFDVEIDPAEELDEFIAHYVSGEPLVYQRQLWPLHHRDSGVWELKTRDVRLFGWFWRVDIFVCSSADDATRVKEQRLYSQHRDGALKFRSLLDLDPPKFIPGDEPRHVVSAFNFP